MRLLERLFGRGWRKDVGAGAVDPPNLLSLCANTPGRTHPHYYGRVNVNYGRLDRCLRCGVERVK